MNLLNNISLKNYNTFGIDCKAAEFVEVSTIDELVLLCQVFNLTERKLLVLGGGSNILLTQDFDGMVVKISIKGITIEQENNEHVWVNTMAGELWHDFVLWCIEKNFAGVENLSLIPGCVGAAPMQNIGAYGVELKNVFDHLKAVEIATGNIVTFTKEQCKFGYRDSVFKNNAKGKYVIISVTFKLNKHPQFNTSYGAIQQTLQSMGVKDLSIKAISNAVISIRSSKLPDPKILGNAGSFFKNPEVHIDLYNNLKKQYPDLIGYPTQYNHVKLAAGWLIEQCGWKGKVVGNTGSHKDQALVLVNYGNATGNEVYKLAVDIQKSVKDKFGIDIMPEVNLI
jgi:UDP-N-acetylmuramate dehydrogenase